MFRTVFTTRSSTRSVFSLSSVSSLNLCTGCFKLSTDSSSKSVFFGDGRFWNEARPVISQLVNYVVIRTNSKSVARTKKVSKNDETPEVLTSEESAVILNTVNEVNQAEDLLKFIVPKKKAEALIKMKNESESKMISSIDQIISIVGVKSSEKFFCSVLKKPIPVTANTAMFPVISAENIKKISTALSICIVGDRISWCLMNRKALVDDPEDFNFNVGELQQSSYDFKPRMHFLTLLDEMVKIVDKLPDAELYIIEEYPATVPTPHMFNFQLQMAQAKSTVLGLIKSRVKDSIIVSIKTVSVARMFNTYIGSEKVSGQFIVDRMISSQHSEPYHIKFTEQVAQDYTCADSKVKEGLSQAFLLNLAYWKMTQQYKIKTR